MEILPYSNTTARQRNKNLFTSTVDTNDGHKRYFSSIDAEIYFGDLFIDDISSIQYEVVEKVMPIYGYNSLKFDFMLFGNRMIQGEFTINFTKSGWLLDIIKTLGSVTDKGDKGNGIGQCCKREDSCGNSAKGLFDGIFDIIVSFGDHNSSVKSYGSSAHMIKGVRINGYRQVLDVSGDPIGETYSFIAQDIDFNIESKNLLDNTFTTGNNNTNKSNSSKPKARSNMLMVAYGNDNNDITNAQNMANKQEALSLSVICEHDYNDGQGTITSSFKILNNSIDKKDIKLTKVSVTTIDKRAEYKGLPVFKSSNFRYSYDNNKDIISIIPMDNMIVYNRQIYKNFKKQRKNAYIDAVMNIELSYKGTPYVISNKPVKITPGATYNF